jgi:hypothetical protein
MCIYFPASQYCSESLRDTRVRVKSKNSISFWKCLCQLIAIPLSHTPDSHDGKKFPIYLELMSLKQGVNRILFCSVNKATGIDKCDIG